MVRSRVLGGRYELLELVGQGSYGQVYRAIDRVTGSVLAVKEFMRGAGRRDGFLRELGLLFDLDHPTIVRCETLLMEEGIRYLVYEFLAEGSLRDYMASAEFDPITGVRLLEATATGVAHAHKHRVIHRDLKPENILLTRDDKGRLTAKVSDFGAAILAQGRGSQPGIGSPAYMAPEQFYDGHDERVDIYALGVIAYELLTGGRPFSGSAEEVMRAHMHEQLLVPEWLPPMTRAMLARALAKAPDDRYASADQLRADLQVIRRTEGDALIGGGWPTEVGEASGVWVTPDWILVLGSDKARRFDRRGRLVEMLARVQTIASAGNHYLIHQDDRWVIQTPVGRRVVTGVPEGAIVKISLEAAIVYTHAGGATLVRGRRSELLAGEGSGVVDVCFCGADQIVCLAVEDASGPHLRIDGRRIELPARPLQIHGVQNEPIVVVEIDDASGRALVVCDGNIELKQVGKGPYCSTGANILGIGPGGELVATNLSKNRVAHTHLGDVACVAACGRLTAWVDQHGFLHATE